MAFLAFMVPKAVPPCRNSSLPPVPEETLASRVAPEEISALPAKTRSAPWVLIVPDESAKAFASVRSLVTEASLKLKPFDCNVAASTADVLDSSASAVSERFVVVLDQLSARFKFPPSWTVVADVVNVAPLTAVAPAGRVKVPPSILIVPAAPKLRLEAARVPPLEESIPALTVIPLLSVKSAAPLLIFSVLASSVTACDTLSPPIELCRVKA